MKLLVLSNLYPNPEQQEHGIFIETRIRNFYSSGNVHIKVCSPIPWFPFKSYLFRKYAIYARIPKYNKRHSIDVIYPRYPIIPKVGMYISPFLMALALIKPLKEIIKSGYVFDLIDAYYLYPDCVAAVILARYFNKPVIITALGSDLNILPKYFIPRTLIKWSIKHASGITTVSKALKTELLRLGANNNIRVILHGVDLHLFHMPNDINSLRKQLGIKRRTLLSVGNLVKLKGHDLIIQALVDLPSTDLIIIGHGKQDHYLKALVKKLNLEDRVRFLGLINQKELQLYYGAADALVLASKSEGIANVLLESMACGTPVIASRVGGLPEMVNTPESGVLLEERTPQAIVKAVSILFRNYPDRSDTRRYAERYSWDSTSKQHLSLIDNVLVKSS